MRFPLAFLAIVLAVLPLTAQDAKDDVPYTLEFNPNTDVHQHDRDAAGKEGLFITVKFTVTLKPTAKRFDSSAYKLVIEEDGHFVRAEDVPVPKVNDDLSVVLALDTSGSMKESKRMDQARTAADIFLAKLPVKAECGLILFDHEIRPPTIAPTLERADVASSIHKVEPRGGTAYLDAAAKAIDMLKDLKDRDRALVIITDGLDVNSKATVEQIIAQGKKHKVRIFTVGIGEPGKLEPVTSVLALDHSGSMTPPADKTDKTPKIKAMHRSASRFVSIMPPTSRTTLIPFSSAVENPKPFTNNKFQLKSDIEMLTPGGETAFFDAVYEALATLEAENPRGKKVVIAMTDGVDNSSRRRVEEVIDRAKDAKIPLYLLGFGRPGELDAHTMEKMAHETGGKFYHARNEKDLMEIFENLSIKIHDDGVDEVTLTRLASETAGQYFPAKNVADLRLILETLSANIQKQFYQRTFPSLRQVRDGLPRRVALKLVHAGQTLSTTTGNVQTRGVVIAEMHPVIYLLFLVILGVLMALPGYLRRTPA